MRFFRSKSVRIQLKKKKKISKKNCLSDENNKLSVLTATVSCQKEEEQ